jgi:prepilin-type N-terminal cleavage/methylation domain-containing protein
MTMELRMDSAATSAEREENRKRGFTLTEIAIVLGIIGLILGAIWVAAAAVYTNMRVARSNQEVLQVTQAIRSLYATATVTGGGNDGTLMTKSLVTAGVFPTDSLNAGAASVYAMSPWTNSYIEIFTDSQVTSAANTGDAFTVQFSGIPPQGCVNLLVSNTGAGRDPGMLTANGATMAAAPTVPTALVPAKADLFAHAVGLADLTVATNSVSAAAASPACGTGSWAAASFTFRLRV